MILNDFSGEDAEYLRNQGEIGNSYAFVLDIPNWKKQKH